MRSQFPSYIVLLCRQVDSFRLIVRLPRISLSLPRSYKVFDYLHIFTNCIIFLSFSWDWIYNCSLTLCTMWSGSESVQQTIMTLDPTLATSPESSGALISDQGNVLSGYRVRNLDICAHKTTPTACLPLDQLLSRGDLRTHVESTRESFTPVSLSCPKLNTLLFFWDFVTLEPNGA